jgi:hypothetical protein
MGHELPRITGGFLVVVLSGHFHVTSKGQEANSIIGVSPFKAEQSTAKSEGKDIHPDSQ